jgi:hypothetical protein
VIIAIDDRCDEDVEDRIGELLNILNYFSTPKQVEIGHHRRTK